MSSKLISVQVGAGLIQVLQLDDPSTLRRFGVTVSWCEDRSAPLVLTGSYSALRKVAKACDQRRSSGRSQPVWYASSAAAAAKRIRKALPKLLTKRDLEKAAQLVGAHVEDDTVGDWVVYQVCAPDGKVWVDTGGIHLCINVGRHPTPESLHEEVRYGIERIAFGLEDDPDA